MCVGQIAIQKVGERIAVSKLAQVPHITVTQLGTERLAGNTVGKIPRITVTQWATERMTGNKVMQVLHTTGHPIGDGTNGWQHGGASPRIEWLTATQENNSLQRLSMNEKC